MTDFEFTLSNESVLVENIKQGERTSFDKLVSLYQQKGLGIAYNLVGNLEDAKDVLQESFVKVYLNIKGFQGKSRFSTWFYRIVVNCALDFLRKKKSSAHFFTQSLVDENGKEEKIEIPDNRFEPAREVLAQELSNYLDNCISHLAQKQRICFMLKHQNGLNIEEISQILKCRPSTVKVHLFRAMGNLRKSLAKYLLR